MGTADFVVDGVFLQTAESDLEIFSLYNFGCGVEENVGSYKSDPDRFCSGSWKEIEKCGKVYGPMADQHGTSQGGGVS